MSPELLASLAVAILTYGLVSKRAERSIFTAPMVCVGVGYFLGLACFGFIALDNESSIIHGFAEITLVLVLFTDAARIDLTCLRREESLPARLLGIGLPLTILVGSIAAALIFPQLSLFECVLLAAILAPTDAALGQVVVSSPAIPVRIRQSLNVESGLNDGIVLPVVLLAASLAAPGHDATSLSSWLRFITLQVTLGPATGVAVGYFGGQLIVRAICRNWMNAVFQRLSSLGLAALAFAGAEMLGGNGFLSAFFAGLTLGNSSRDICTCLYEFGEAEGQLLTLLVFTFLGAFMLPEVLSAIGWRACGYAALSLSLLRMLPVALSLFGSKLRPVSIALLGWFGPRGLASILFVLIVIEEFPVEHSNVISNVTMLTVLLSTIAHGITAYPFAHRYSSRVHKAKNDHPAEHRPAPDLPVRISNIAVEM